MQRNSAPDMPALNSPDEPVGIGALFANTAYIRLWRVVVRFFLFAGFLGVLEQAWWIGSEVQARYTWPTASGTVISSTIKDDENVPGKIVDRRHTQYWVEYEVRFAAGADQCGTRTFDGGPPSSLSCIGKVRTRNTRSSHEAWEWMNSGYGANRSVTVLYNPSGPQIEIAGSSIWLFYDWTKAVLVLVWVTGFFIFHTFLQRRLKYFRSRPEAEGNHAERRVADEHKLTDLDLS